MNAAQRGVYSIFSRSRQGKEKANPPSFAFHPWATPPIGSDGAAWDGYDILPRDPMLDRQLDQARQQAERTARQQRAKEEIRLARPAYKAPLHPLTIAAWVLTFFALFSTGPAVWLRLPWAGLALLTAGAAIWWITNRNVLHRGKREAWFAVAAIITIIAWHFLGKLVWR